MATFEIEPVGFVRSSRTEPLDDAWDSESSHIELIAPFNGAALQGVTDFSHCVVVYLFDRAAWDESKMARHPRGNTSWPRVGIFAQRAKDRPNRLGVTICRVVDVIDNVLVVSGLDAIDGTPVIDIKPHMNEFGPRGEVTQPSWATELMAEYW